MAMGVSLLHATLLVNSFMNYDDFWHIDNSWRLDYREPESEPSVWPHVSKGAPWCVMSTRNAAHRLLFFLTGLARSTELHECVPQCEQRVTPPRKTPELSD